MPRNVTITFGDGTQHVYQNVPDTVNPDQMQQRVAKDFAGKEVTAMDGGRKPAQAPPEDTSALSGFAGGLLKPLDNLTSAAMNIPGAGMLDRVGQSMGLPSAQHAIAHNDQMRQNNTRTGFQTLGNIAGTLPTMALPGGALAQGAASGALLSDAKDPGSAAWDATLGAAGSKLTSAAAHGLAWAAKPVVSKGAQLLHDAGIDLTLGQLARDGKGLGSKIVAGLEDRAAGLPFIGDMVNAARGRGTEQLNKKVAGDALAAIGEKLPAKINVGHELLDHVQDRLSEKYKDVVPRLVGHVDKQFGDDLQVAKDITATLPRDRQRQFKKIITSVFENRMDPTGKTISGQALKDAETSLGEYIRRYGKPTATGDESGLADALKEARQALRSMAVRSDKSGGELQSINQGWAKLKQAQGSANLEGVVTPTGMLRQSLKTGWGKELARAAQKTLPNKVPDSGTAGRVLTGQMMLGGGGAALAPFSTPAAAIPLAAAGFYTKPGMKALNQFVFRKAGTSATAAKAIQGAAKLAPVLIPPLLRAR